MNKESCSSKSNCRQKGCLVKSSPAQVGVIEANLRLTKPSANSDQRARQNTLNAGKRDKMLDVRCKTEIDRVVVLEERR